MQTHPDRDGAQEFMRRLQERAESMTSRGESQITAGAPGEEALAVWRYREMQVTHMPDDPDGILRISVGGGEDLPVNANYLVFRGDVGKCRALLQKALVAITKYAGCLLFLIVLTATSHAQLITTAPWTDLGGIDSQSRSTHFTGARHELYAYTTVHRQCYWRSDLPPFALIDAAAFTVVHTPITGNQGIQLLRTLATPSGITWGDVPTAGVADGWEDPHNAIQLGVHIGPGNLPSPWIVDVTSTVQDMSRGWIGNHGWAVTATTSPSARRDVHIYDTHLAISYWPAGDSNQDTVFDSTDLVAVFIAGKYETGQPATWAEGDWNGDGVFDSSDFVAVFIAGTYVENPAIAGTSAIEEYEEISE